MHAIRDDLLELAATFPEAVRSTLTEVLADPGFRGVVPAAAVDELARALRCSVPEVMLELLPFSERFAHPEVSRFRVGALAQGTSGAVYLGANLEYEGVVPSFTLHAEQSAVNNAWSNGETGLDAIVVTHAPCGHCRQFLYETSTASALDVHVKGKGSWPLTELLPHAFGPADLPDVAAAFMTPELHALAIEPAPTDAVVLAALEAASSSYAPYSKSFAGVALQTRAGAVHSGRYAENAAFNPSMPPLVSALALRALAGNGDDAIVRAVLVHVPAAVDHVASTETLLRVVSNVDLEVHAARVAA